MDGNNLRKTSYATEQIFRDILYFFIIISICIILLIHLNSVAILFFNSLFFNSNNSIPNLIT